MGQPRRTVTIDGGKHVKGELKNIGGSRSDDWNQMVVNQICNGQWVGDGSNKEQVDMIYRGAVVALADMKPADELEAMMCSQLISAHAAAQECYKRAMLFEQPSEARQANLNQANKLSRTFATLVEALNRHRGKGSLQRVTVEHVHVHEGGQAIVGAVSAGEGGQAPKIGGQSHAKIADARVAALPRQDTARDALPVAGHAKRSMQDARRHKSRRA